MQETHYQRTGKVSVNEPWFMARGRERKARLMDGLAVGLLMAFMAMIGAAAYFLSVPR